jgi:hypothetical protein
MQWIAADFIGNITIELYSNDVLFYTSGILGVGGPGNFGGLISEQPFDKARIYDDLDNILAMDDLHFGPPIAVPAPGAFAIFGLAVLTRRRRGRSTRSANLKSH